MIFFTKIKITNENDQKIEHLREERAVLEHRRARGLRFGERGVGIPVEREKKIAEVDPAGQHADERHDDVVDERRYDFPERAADNDADRHIDHVPFTANSLNSLSNVFIVSPPRCMIAVRHSEVNELIMTNSRKPVLIFC